MRLKQIGDAGTLEVLALGYKMNRVLNKEYNLTPINAAILLLLGSFSNQSKTDEITKLSVPEMASLMAYSKSNRVNVYYAANRLCEGIEPYLRKEKVKNIIYFSLTPKGVELIRNAVKLTKVFRFEYSQVTA
jgi:hypothetical protein